MDWRKIKRTVKKAVKDGYVTTYEQVYIQANGTIEPVRSIITDRRGNIILSANLTLASNADEQGTPLVEDGDTIHGH